MSQAVRVDLREATLSESASLSESEGEAPCFIALDNPPPVRSLLRVHVGEDARIFEVSRVIEVVGEDESRRGCYGRFVEGDRISEQQRVGSEHLEPGISGGVPAPVVIMNTGDMMLPDLPDEPDEAPAGESGDAPAGESGDAPAEAGAGDGADAPAEPSGDASGEASGDAPSDAPNDAPSDSPSDSPNEGEPRSE